jgi:hypothetical protein
MGSACSAGCRSGIGRISSTRLNSTSAPPRPPMSTKGISNRTGRPQPTAAPAAKPSHQATDRGEAGLFFRSATTRLGQSGGKKIAVAAIISQGKMPMLNSLEFIRWNNTAAA